MVNRIISIRYQYLKSFNCVQIKQLVLDINTWNHLTVCKQMSYDSFKDVAYKLFA